MWKYPTLEKVTTLTGHSSRVLFLAMNPSGETIVTGAGDETLRFWNIFPSLKPTNNMSGNMFSSMVLRWAGGNLNWLLIILLYILYGRNSHGLSIIKIISNWIIRLMPNPRITAEEASQMQKLEQLFHNRYLTPDFLHQLIAIYVKAI